jgi:hypothetical protein
MRGGSRSIRRKDEIIPELIKILEYTEKNIHKIENDPDYVAHMFAMSLLAKFREKRALSSRNKTAYRE